MNEDQIKRENRDAQIPLRVTKTLKAELSDLAWENKRTLNDLINRILQSYVNRKKQQKK